MERIPEWELCAGYLHAARENRLRLDLCGRQQAVHRNIELQTTPHCRLCQLVTGLTEQKEINFQENTVLYCCKQREYMVLYRYEVDFMLSKFEVSNIFNHIGRLVPLATCYSRHFES